MDKMTNAPATLGRPPFDLSAEFSHFRQNWPDKLHFAAHSHHFWPDATREAHLRAWDDAARLVDGKWQEVLGPVWQKVAQGVAKHLNLPGIDGLVPANNTHEFVNRLLSCLPRERKPRILTSDAEFHSFRRQIERLAEDGLIELTVVPAEPFASLTERLVAAATQSPGPDMVFVSQVHFNSGYALTDLEALVDGVSAPGRLVVIDGYHGFLARPTDLSAIADKAFYIAGGYKYAMSGEGACFMHCPPGFAMRPRDTGWYASFGALAGPQDSIGYTQNGWRFMGATFDPSGLYRMGAMFDWLGAKGLDVPAIHAHAHALQEIVMAGLAQRPCGVLAPENLVVPLSEPARGNFLTFRHADAALWHEKLKQAGITVDLRGDRLRVGFGLYQNAADVETLLGRLAELA
ncbi:aminotransferase class V-fold PLP-dependent enzyme [Bosea sp. LjRoot237]|uniref:aminotransferase class V-fold PLP-dependent enzyme n=1 Tax=Bosea sp. LjRoot237 TaxID=3342292 RepID=UPI003ECD0916